MSVPAQAMHPASLHTPDHAEWDLLTITSAFRHELGLQLKRLRLEVKEDLEHELRKCFTTTRDVLSRSVNASREFEAPLCPPMADSQETADPPDLFPTTPLSTTLERQMSPCSALSGRFLRYSPANHGRNVLQGASFATLQSLDGTWRDTRPRCRRRQSVGSCQTPNVVYLSESSHASPNSQTSQPRTWRMPLLHPHGRWQKVWKPLICIILLVAVVMTPFDVAFHWWREPMMYTILSKVSDLLCIADVLVNFNTAVIHYGRMETSRRQIAILYAKSYLLPDLASNIPFDWFAVGDGSDWKKRKLAKLLKLPKILRFVKLIRAFKDGIEYVGVTEAIGCLILLSHYIACFWVWTLAQECDSLETCPPVGVAYLQALRIGVASLTTTEPAVDNFASGETDVLFLTSGRAPGESLRPHEDLVAAVIPFLGFTLLGFLFAFVASTLKLHSEASLQRHRALEHLKVEMAVAGTPANLEQKVLATYEHISSYGTAKDQLLRDPMLSLDLRREIALHMHGDALRRVPILRQVPDCYLKCLAQNIVIHLFTPGDLLMMYGEVGKELFIIVSGVAQFVSQTQDPTPDSPLIEGDYCGELCFLHPGSRREISVMCFEVCQAMALTLEAFQGLALDDVLDQIRNSSKILA